jgi:predicted nucleic acid-binding protein
VSAYDALYLAVAVNRSASVLTCDGRLSRAPATGVAVENVRVT